VPTRDESRLNTAYGLLLNELARSPAQLVQSLKELMRLALALDTGLPAMLIGHSPTTGCAPPRDSGARSHLPPHSPARAGSYFASQADIILYVMRLVSRIENFIAFLLAPPPDVTLRDTPVTAEVHAFLADARASIHTTLEQRFQPVLRRWIREWSVQCEMTGWCARSHSLRRHKMSLTASFAELVAYL